MERLNWISTLSLSLSLNSLRTIQMAKTNPTFRSDLVLPLLCQRVDFLCFYRVLDYVHVEINALQI
jgi:hypothetical protein